MYTETLSAWLLACGLSLALSSASCGNTCPANEPNCGNSNPGANSAGAASTDATTCDLLKAFRTCMTDYCKTASNPFCTCYKRGFDIAPGSCLCVDFDAKNFCAQAERSALDATTYDCAADSSRVSSFCVPVK